MSERRELALLATGRTGGKSTQAFAWVSHGVRAPGYPGWSRVLLLAHGRAFDLHRRDYWPRLEDFDHRVYTLRDWVDARAVDPATEVCIDDLEDAIRTTDLRRLPGRLVAATMTTAAWDRLEFREAPARPTGVRLR